MDGCCAACASTADELAEMSPNLMPFSNGLRLSVCDWAIIVADAAHARPAVVRNMLLAAGRGLVRVGPGLGKLLKFYMNLVKIFYDFVQLNFFCSY